MRRLAPNKPKKSFIYSSGKVGQTEIMASPGHTHLTYSSTSNIKQTEIPT